MVTAVTFYEAVIFDPVTTLSDDATEGIDEVLKNSLALEK
jgi:hypothetical protein